MQYGAVIKGSWLANLSWVQPTAQGRDEAGFRFFRNKACGRARKTEDKEQYRQPVILGPTRSWGRARRTELGNQYELEPGSVSWRSPVLGSGYSQAELGLNCEQAVA